MAESVGEFGILHFDAHSDTRVGYEGFTYSHASIMYNALQEVPQIKKLVQVGIRDFSEDEVNYCASQGSRVKIYFDTHLRRRMQDGNPWNTIAQEIVTNLPRNVWVSFDIDGLDPKLCPNTGTPVPGGLEFLEANAILRALVQSGRKIIGFDLNEVAPDPTGSSEWDANVGARLLYKLCAWTFASQKICNVRD
jgi:agmatinase